MPASHQDVSRGGFLKDNAELIGIAIRFMDFTIIVVGALLAHYVRFNTIDLDLGYKIALVVVLFGAAALFPLLDLYQPWRGRSIWTEVSTLVFGWFCVVTLIPALVYLTKTGELYSRLWFGYWVLITAALFIISRYIIRNLAWWARQRGLNTRNVLIVGAGDLGQQVSVKLEENDWAGLHVVGYLDDDPEILGSKIGGVPVVGTTEKIKELVSDNSSRQDNGYKAEINLKEVDQVWVALPLAAKEKIKEVCSILDDSAVSVIFVPDIFLHDLLNHSVDDLAGMPVVNLRASPIEGISSTVKFVEDIIISVLAIVFTAPLMVLIAVAIKLDSAGPVLFKQRRYGIDGREIVIWKFRTMHVMEDSTKITQAKKNDPRVSKIGAFLRKTSLDELPQFFNVLQGRMSVVGPRPHAVAHNEQYRKIVDRYMWRCKLKPGITGWAQVNGWRGETDVVEKMQKRIEYDLEYLANWSLWLDIKIIFKTVINGFTDKNAY